METAQTELFDPPTAPAPLMTGLDPVAYQPDPARVRHEAIHREVEAALRNIVETRPNYQTSIYRVADILLACGAIPQSAPLTYDQVMQRHNAWRVNHSFQGSFDLAKSTLMADAANAVLEGCNSGADYHSATATRGICEMFGIDYDAIVARVDGEGQV